MILVLGFVLKQGDTIRIQYRIQSIIQKRIQTIQKLILTIQKPIQKPTIQFQYKRHYNIFFFTLLTPLSY